MQCCIEILLHCCTAALLHCCTAALLHCCITLCSHSVQKITFLESSKSDMRSLGAFVV